MNNGKFDKTAKEFRGKTHLKNNSINKFYNEIFEENNPNKIKSNTKKQFIIVNNKGINCNQNLLIENNPEIDDNNINKNLFSEFQKEESLKSRPPTQSLIKRTASPFVDNFNNINNFYSNKLEDNKKREKESNLNKFNKKNYVNGNQKIINDLIPFNDIYKKNKQVVKNNHSNNKIGIKSGKVRTNNNDMEMNFFINYNEIFDFKKKVKNINWCFCWYFF